MNDNATLENENVVSESILLLKPNKKAIFKMGMNMIFQRYMHYTSMVFEMSYLKNLGPFTIIPYLTQNIKIYIEIRENGLEIVKLFWKEQNPGSVRIDYCYGTATDRIQNYSKTNRMFRCWIREKDTDPDESYILTNVYVNMYPEEKKIELRQLKGGKYLLLETFENVKDLLFYSESGIPSVLQNFKLLPESMNHQIKRKFWKEKYNLSAEFVVTILFATFFLVCFLSLLVQGTNYCL